MTPDAKTLRIKALGREVGFADMGVAPAGPVDANRYYRPWLEAGYAGEMTYLHRNTDIRADSTELLPGARSVICVALSYKRPKTAPPTPTAAPHGRLAMYARGRDYHVVLRRMLDELTDRMRAEFDEPFDVRPCVDSAPILERAVGRLAGLGWIGKNTMLLSREMGSYFFLGELVTTLELTPDAPQSDHCGSCTRCLDACPTSAFPEPRVLDARRCISYLTIEFRGDLPEELAGKTGDWVFGCDVCQQVCPYNAKAPDATHPDVVADLLPPTLDLAELIELRSGAYRRLVKDTALRRASRNMLRRNAETALRSARPS